MADYVADNSSGNKSAQVVQPVRGLLVDRSGTSHAVQAKMVDANNWRTYLIIQNPNASTSIWVAFGKAAVAASPSIEIPKGTALIFSGSWVPTDQVNVISAGDQAFTAWEGSV